MLFSVELLNLILYCVQQLGIALGLGAQTIMLVAFASAMRDGVIDEYEAQFLRATRNTLWVSLAFIIVSGLFITALHLIAGQAATVLTPAYLFKSLLIIAVVVLTAALHLLPETFAEGILGGTWYALFLVHILAPVTTWFNLLTLLVVWLIGFNLFWYVIAFSTRAKKLGAKDSKATAPMPKSSEAIILEKVPPAPAALHDLPQIRLDPVPKTQPVIIKEAPAPIMMQVPVAPAQQVKIAPAPITMPKQPVEKLPGTIATDTPFLPQVPPLLPIPVTSPITTGQPPALQKPEELPTTSVTPPEVKLGLNVMPKSPTDVNK